MNKIILIGFMGAGKTSVGRGLSQKLQVPFYDLDEVIEKEEKRSIPEIFAAEGEGYFRDIESKMLEKMLQSKEPMVLSLGGGTPIRPENQTILRQSKAFVIYLSVTAQTVFERVGHSTNRPLIAAGGSTDEERFSHIGRLMASREEAYRTAADAVITADGKTPQAMVNEIGNLTAQR